MNFFIFILITLLTQASPVSQVRSHSMRFKPNQNLVHQLNKYVNQNFIKAASISTCVGSLLKCTIRYANQEQTTELEGHFEIVSLVGTISEYGSHIHISIADGEGKMYGGHLPMDGNECIIYTTAEIVLLEHIDSIFIRTIDPTYGYKELEVV